MKHTEIWTCAASIIAAVLIAGISLAVASGYQDDAWQARADAAVYKADCMGLTAQVQDLTDTVDLLKNLDALPAGMTATYAGEFTLTSYCTEHYPHICGTGDGITASGAPVTPGLTVAADLDKLPLGTVVYISGVGVRVVQDTGSGLQGNHIDVAVPGTHEDALNWPLGGSVQSVWILGGTA